MTAIRDTICPRCAEIAARIVNDILGCGEWISRTDLLHRIRARAAERTESTISAERVREIARQAIRNQTAYSFEHPQPIVDAMLRLCMDAGVEVTK